MQGIIKESLQLMKRPCKYEKSNQINPKSSLINNKQATLFE